MHSLPPHGESGGAEIPSCMVAGRTLQGCVSCFCRQVQPLLQPSPAPARRTKSRQAPPGGAARAQSRAAPACPGPDGRRASG